MKTCQHEGCGVALSRRQRKYCVVHGSMTWKNKRRIEANPEKCRERSRAWAAANPEKHRERSRAWKEANPEKHREHARAKYVADPEKYLEHARAWAAANPEKHRESGKKYRSKTRADHIRRNAIADAFGGKSVEEIMDMP
jgi:ABC-type nitrate/sulfonate/bicarbonate transport system substrate-binding protein